MTKRMLFAAFVITIILLFTGVMVWLTADGRWGWALLLTLMLTGFEIEKQ